MIITILLIPILLSTFNECVLCVNIVDRVDGLGFHCPESYVYIYDGCYLLSQTTYNWFDAISYCALHDGKLVTMESEEQNRQINQYFRTTGFYQWTWIGLNDVSVDTQFAWIDGSNFSFSYWYQSSVSTTQNCVAMCETNTGKWCATYCSDSQYTLCKWNNGNTVSFPVG